MALTETEIRRIIGRRIREARLAKDLSGIEVARRLGVTSQAYYWWENGHGLPIDSRRYELAWELGVPHTALFGLDGELDGEVA